MPRNNSSRTSRLALRPSVELTLDPSRWAALKELTETLGMEPSQLVSVWVKNAIDRVGAMQLVSDATPKVSAQRRTQRRPGQGIATGKHNTSLHDEILAVLNERGGQMAVGEIAEAIRRRKRYQPRRGGAITTQAVSSRLANPQYRSLFERNGRLVSAGPVAQAPEA
jgi:hypothetical protein